MATRSPSNSVRPCSDVFLASEGEAEVVMFSGGEPTIQQGHGLLRLGRGKVTVLDPGGITAEAGG